MKTKINLKEKIYQKYLNTNRPFAALFEVTQRCMCQCIHCYLADQNINELDIHEISDLFEQLKNIGVINLGITGGEPFLRTDLVDILKLTYKHHFFVCILTTGILIDQEKIEWLKKYHIWNLEISLLGATSQTHDSIMRYPGAFDKTINSIKILKKENINITLKSTILKENYHELDLMEKLAHSLNSPFQANINIAAKTDHNLAPLDHLITLDELKKIKSKNIISGIIPDEDFSNGALLTCNAGKTIIGIDPKGEIFPCLLFRHPLGNIRNNKIENILINNPSPFLQELRNIKDNDVKECFNCDLKKFCRRCPGAVYLETQKIKVASPTSCKIANLIAHRKN